MPPELTRLLLSSVVSLTPAAMQLLKISLALGASMSGPRTPLTNHTKLNEKHGSSQVAYKLGLGTN